jgi:hypothetical protein
MVADDGMRSGDSAGEIIYGGSGRGLGRGFKVSRFRGFRVFRVSGFQGFKDLGT